MKSIFLFICLFYFILGLEQSSCEYYSTVNRVSTYDECKSLDVSKEGNQCCIGVISYLGNNQIFCGEFPESATENEIDSQFKTDYLDHLESTGVKARGKVSCTGDIDTDSFTWNKCKIEDTQRTQQFGNCTNFKKEKDSDYCCLFSANLRDDSEIEVQFCEELDENQAKNANQIAKNIDSSSPMYNVKYLTCSPEIPDEKESDRPSGSCEYLNINLIIILISLLLFSF